MASSEVADAADDRGRRYDRALGGIPDWLLRWTVAGVSERAVLVCVLCGLIVLEYYDGSMSYPSKCAANAGGQHISPDSPAAKEAQELHAAWLRDPFSAVREPEPA